MRQIRLGTFAPILILLVSILSCAPFMNGPKPTQVVDLPSMVGKSLQEMETMLGPSKLRGVCYNWQLPEGELVAGYKDHDSAKKKMSTLWYRFPSYTFFVPGRAVSSPEEMAALVKIDIKGRKPDSEFRGGYAYDNLSLNGKSVDVAFDGGPKRIVGVSVHPK